jgi:hypothetical protein
MGLSYDAAAAARVGGQWVVGRQEDITQERVSIARENPVSDARVVSMHLARCSVMNIG